jgi:hypothetical protein
MLLVPDILKMLCPSGKENAPDGRELLRLFRYRKHKFMHLNEELLKLSALGFKGLAGPRPDPENRALLELEKKDLKTIRRGLLSLGIRAGVDCTPVSVRYTSYSLPATGYAGGFYYSETEPKNFFIDESPIREKPFGSYEEKRYPEYGPYIVYVRLCDNWYLFEAYED